jgi:SAM-dependent methyltransferase
VSLNPSSRWCPADYAKNAAFVPALGAAALGLLDPKPGEIILDLGCGDGALTALIEQAGAKAIGLDASPEMVEAARARGVDAYVADGQALGLAQAAHRFGQFDAAFSNAALHWMLDPVAVANGVHEVLRPGGRFVGEMGGEGNLVALRSALREELAMRGYTVPAEDPQWYAGIDEFTRVYRDAGFEQIETQLIPRETDLPGGIQPWMLTFRSGFMTATGVPETEHVSVAQAVERRVSSTLQRPGGGWFADYVRLRFTMRKPL